jgi:hypothetical protein
VKDVDQALERQYRDHMRDRYLCVVNDNLCDERLGPVRLVPHEPSLVGNSVIMCQHHHRMSQCTALVRIGQKRFERLYRIKLKAIAQWCQWDFEEQLSFGEPPPGVHYRGENG